ncbi:hypothetical protein [Borreliella valaisiana]|uniref:Uncharacterized protein n=1 Tax=Borreliella valaisiana VS116 TaxID=445987 RepID=D6RY33_BORVA|nr:hypothetical protein [Borreliella valaisiana]AIJ29899.1 hypothetical protein P613_02780 [Borreliella valaisiana Tom4006]EEF81845.1 conserved hypothetical protein [Borreliella valaisiana VS116]WKC77176.1 hypothetical protein QIA32_03275 [Borreliella valaisiana]WLN25337.1 hypothetical protein KJD10_02725 [Borreliella valaisiana]WVN14260.1 hypothetical protein KJD09_02760 [Borreliella valaisiana]
MSANEILKKYFSNLLLELKELKLLLTIESDELQKEEIRILNVTNPKKDLILESITNYYKTINAWLKYKNQKLDNFDYLIKEINLLKEEIYIKYQTCSKILQQIINAKRKIPKIKKHQNPITVHNSPIMLDIKI